MNLVNKLKNLILGSSMSISEIARKSNISRQSLYKIIRGTVSSVSSDTINAICSAINVAPETLYISNDKKGVRIPVLGTIPAGIPIEAIEEVLDYEEIPEDLAKRGKFFALKIKGNSMSPTILENDIVIFEQVDDADSGSTCAVMVNGNDATIKKIRKDVSGISLIPNNPSYDVMFYSNEEIISKPVRIIGKAIEIRRSL